MPSFVKGGWAIPPLSRFIFPTEGIVDKGDIGVSQAAYGLDSRTKISFQTEVARLGEREPVRLRPLQKKYKVKDADLRTFIISYLDYWLSGSQERIQPTKFGLVAGIALAEVKYKRVWEIFDSFKRTDRIRIIDSLSTGNTITKNQIRAQMLFPGSLNHNLLVLKAAHAVEMRGDRITPGTYYSQFLDALNMMQNCFSEVRRHRRDRGISLKVSQIMTAGNFVTAALADNLAEVVSRMIFQGVNGVIIPIGEPGQYVLIERSQALKAYSDGYGTRTIQSLPESLRSAPVTATAGESVSEVAGRMSQVGVEHAVVLDDKKEPKGVVSSKDVLSLLLYHAQLPGDSLPIVIK